MIKNFFKKLFSISDYGETHRTVCVCGIKIKFPKNKYRKAKKESSYYFYKKYNVDIKTIPPAEGQIRDIQLANLAILKEFDRVCAENGLQYFFTAGTALGAIRHKGFIPWDDDIDTAMLRDDFNRVIEVFNKNTHNKNLEAKPYNNKKYGSIIKIYHKNSSIFFIDIFAMDYSNGIRDKKEQFKITATLLKERQKLAKKLSKDYPDTSAMKIYDEMKNKYVSDKKTVKNDIIWGLEWLHSEKNWFIKYDSVFPLTKVEFEGYEFSAMAHAMDYLTDYYGDIFQYPRKITMGHSMYLELSEKEKQIIEELKGTL